MKYSRGKFINLGRTKTKMPKPVRINLHTAVANASSLAHVFRDGPYSHFYVNKSGVVEQYQDTKYRAAADYKANNDTISIETWDGYDGKSWLGGNVPPWTDAQIESLAYLVAELFKAHPTIPRKLATNNLPGITSQGLSWHRLGVPGDGKAGYAKPGGILYSSKKNKACPGDKRIAQIPLIFDLALKILNAPTVKKPKKFALGQINIRAQRWGGLPETSEKPGLFLQNMDCSIFLLSEVSEDRRNAIRKVLKGYLTYPHNWVCVMWDSAKWQYVPGNSVVSFGNSKYHGAIRVTLIDPATKDTLDIISVFVRSSDAIGGSDEFILKEKQADIRLTMDKLYRKGQPTVVAGDFNTGTMGNVIEKYGLVRATEPLDTHDKVKDQKIDAVFITPDLQNRGSTLIDPKEVTDHKAWRFSGTLNPIPVVTN